MEYMMTTRCIGIIGAGTMGTQIAALVASSGHDVLIFDICAPASIDKQILRTQRFLKRADYMQAHLAAVPGACRVAVNIRDLADAAIVIECVAENMPAKCDVLSTISSIVGNDTMIGTNTSSLSLDALAKRVSNNSRFLGVHFFNPVHAVALVELCALPDTAPSVIHSLRTFLESLGRTVVKVPNSPGFVVNRLLFLMIASAARMLDEGGISPADVDTAMKAGTNMPMGPLELAGLIGLDICSSILSSLHEQTGDAAYATPRCILECVQNKNLGRKSGYGLYEWERKV
jgi:3-hydroxybutyryl-CoA dehydrogenase